MTDEMRMAEALVRDLAPPGLEVPIPEPLALDESRWFLTAIDKVLIEFTHCNGLCTRVVDHQTRRDHFEPNGEGPRHLFSCSNRKQPSLQRDFIPCIAAFARAVLDFGYDADAASLLCHHQRRRRLSSFLTSSAVRSDVEFPAPDGTVHLQITAMAERQTTRRLATAVDGHGSLARLPAGFAAAVGAVLTSKPHFLWLVGPNAVEPAHHVFRVDVEDDDAYFERIDAVPLPV